MNNNTFKISKRYWDSLTEKEQLFLRMYASQYGVSYCKRILTLAKNFGDYSGIILAREYYQMDNGINTIAFSSAFIVLKLGNPIGLIQKSYDNIGISERIRIYNGNGCPEIWNNYYKINPPKALFNNIRQEYATSVV